MSKLSDKYNNVYYEQLKEFCEGYVLKMESLMELSDFTYLESLNKSEQSIMVDRHLNKKNVYFDKMTDSEIKGHFESLRILALKEIDANILDTYLENINDYINSNVMYAKKLKFNTSKNKLLSIDEYYINYLVAKEVSSHLDLMIQRGRFK